MEGVETPSKTWKSNKAGRNDPHPMHGAKAGHPGHRIPPSTSLNIGVETAAGLSNQVETRVEQATPGILATGASGGSVSIRATGIIWLAKFPTVRLFVRIGTQYVPIESITTDSQDAGVSTLTVTLPSDISGDSVPVTIEVVQTDGRSVASNPASISTRR